MSQHRFSSRPTALAGLAAAALLVTACAAPAPSAAGEVFDPQKTVVLSEGDRAFVNINPAIKMAPAYGDRAKGAHGSFGQFPANFVTPMHTHSGAYHGIVVKGVMTNPFEGEKTSPEMQPGSYWYVPAEAVHATACVSDTPCEFYFHADSAFDFHPTE